MNKETSFELRIPMNIYQLDGHVTPEIILNQFSWQVETKKVVLSNGNPQLGIFVRCNIQQPCPSDWCAIAAALVRLEPPRVNMRSLEKPIYFMAFNPGINKRGNDRLMHWNDIKRFVNEEKITIHIKIQAIGLSNANNSVNITTLSHAADAKLKVRATFRDIQTTFALMSPEIHYDGSAFRICIFKRPYVSEQEPHRSQDALWLYLVCSRIGENEHRKWSYKIKMLTPNGKVGPLCTEEKNIRFSTGFDSTGAPFIMLEELFDQRNKYLSSDGAINMEMELAVMAECRSLSAFDLNNVRIKTEPKSPKRPASPPLVPIERGAINAQPVQSLAHIKVEVTAAATEYSADVTDAQPRDQSASGIAQPSGIRKRAAVPTELKCILCPTNLLHEFGVFTTKCGHLYCKECLDDDVCKRQMCLKCNSHIEKAQCTQIYLTDEQRKMRNCTKTRSSLSLRYFLDNFDQDTRNRASDHPSNQVTRAPNHLLSCPLCEGDLVENDSDVFTIQCGHLYCRNCLFKDIAYRRECVVCNKRDRGMWTQIFFP
ncbi:uncharacterized protein LOC129575186 isoform X1 [Sitodiplosis mosellana]|uniref:uncharacterized protein LOC129575186 isoform X1 n=1 Tax=Sitodiplosis mosellana TaxID=263140 RepID=UPI0024438A30|nr:uncharacterized protein LOC129575186 isoform X1 [Sitodiplosis mosellana]